MEEKKENKNCCEPAENNSKCPCLCFQKCCFANKNSLLRILIIIISVLIIFCLGYQMGKINSFYAHSQYYKKDMMNRKYENYSKEQKIQDISKDYTENETIEESN